jgi:hypothetical protein
MDGRCRKLAFIAGGKVYMRKANGKGRAHRESGAGASYLDISGSGRYVTYERDGFVWVAGVGRTRRLTRGSQPSANSYATFAAFVRGDQIMQVTLQGRPRVSSVRQYPGGSPRGTQPSMSFGHSFVFYVDDGPDVRSNGFATSMGRCDNGGLPHHPVTSPHGNYVVYACTGGGVYMTYVGPK